MSEILRIGGDTNAIVVQLPERQQSGVVVQQDSMQNLLELTKAAKAECRRGERVETESILEEIEGLLSGYLAMFPER